MDITKQKKIRVAMIGLGWVGLNRHMPAILKNTSFDLMGVIDRRSGKAEAISKQKNLKHFAQAEHLSDVPWLDEVDAITISTCPQSHATIIKEALLAGKHVLTEKPFTMNVSEGEELLSLAKEKQLTLAIVHNFQFASSSLKLARDLDAGKLGKVKGLIAYQLGNPKRRLPEWYEDLPLGLFYDESPHLLYLLRRFAPGALEWHGAQIDPSSHGLNTPSSITAHFRSTSTEGTIPAKLQLFFESPVSEWYLVVLGEDKLGIVDVFRDIYICLPNDGIHQTGTVLRTSLCATLQHWGQHFTSGIAHLTGSLNYGNSIVFERFAKAIHDNAPPEGISAEDALAVLRLQHKIISEANYF